MIRSLVFILCLCLLLPANAKAANQAKRISPRIYKGLKKTEALISKKNYQQAEQKLKGLLANVSQKSYGHATVLRSLSSVYALKGQYKKAAETLSQCLSLNLLPDDQKQYAVLNLAQLYMATEQYTKAIRTMKPYLATQEKLDVEINVMIANAYTQLKQYQKALPYIKKALSTSKKPKESWYQLNLAIYFELKDYSSVANILKKLIHIYPEKKTYWNQLSSIYQQLKQYKKAVSVKHLAYKKDFISSEKDLLGFANLLLFIDSPFKAAKLIKKEIEHKRIKSNSRNWETLANAWTMAKEFDNAIKALEIASKLKQKGTLYQQLGQIYVEKEKWSQAITSLNKALNKGGLKNIGTCYLLLGISHYELKQIKQAEKSFLKASKYGKSKKAAWQWLNYIKPTTL
ncbi:MAG: tetratricopeptide repeat protein [Methylococcales symbiont of Hymedesmia sp. n. MRB-2018]|nr:MAG: tetratricopeptide repeat protein [Methylococcales symbiont of Hymedesmia sp. n. MRB-2018]